MAAKRVWKKRVFTPEQWARRMANQQQYRRRPEVRAGLLPYKRAEADRYRAQRRAELSQKSREYARRNRDLVLQRKREYYARNKERLLAAHRERSRRNPDAASRRKRAYYVRNRERILSYMREYSREHRQQAHAHWHARRARERSAPGRFTAAEFAHVVAEFKGRCAYCGRPGPLTADHRIPLSRAELRPRNDISNILPACRPCNSSKSRKTESEFREWLRRNLRASDQR